MHNQEEWQKLLAHGSSIYYALWDRTRSGTVYVSFYWCSAGMIIPLNDLLLQSGNTAARSYKRGDYDGVQIRSISSMPVLEAVAVLGEVIWNDAKAFRAVQLNRLGEAQ